MKIVSVWSRSRWSRLFLPGAGADPIWSELESVPGTWTSGAGAALKSCDSATLVSTTKQGVIYYQMWNNLYFQT